jgi:glycine dehydrogenase
MGSIEMSHAPNPLLNASDTFAHRHLGPGELERREMLGLLGFDSLDALSDAVVPASIRLRRELNLATPAAGPGQPAMGERAALECLKGLAQRNVVKRSCIGMGYHDCFTPGVIQRNILENPGWYTQYTPYQAEIAQGRLEALLNFQTLVADLTGLPLANASLLDEGTAAAEAMAMCVRVTGRRLFFACDHCHPQTLAVLRTRARFAGVELRVLPASAFAQEPPAELAGVIVQTPDTTGLLATPEALRALAQRLHAKGAMLAVGTDPLALVITTPPGECGADLVFGSAQRFGVPMGFGGPHAAYLATHEAHARRMPGRIVGVSRDARGRRALRLAIQTREQHIRRDKATSNICTAQVLLAVMAGMYAVYHGPHGLRRIAHRVHAFALALRQGLVRSGVSVVDGPIFDTVTARVPNAREVVQLACDRGYNLRLIDASSVGVSFDETTTRHDVAQVLAAFGVHHADIDALEARARDQEEGFPRRETEPLRHEVFNLYHSETQMLRYIRRLESRDLSLTHAMIPLGSCTMKLNATVEMQPVTWEAFGRMHPFCPPEQARGYREMIAQLESWLAEVTGFDAVSLQPNAGSQGEYAGLLAIKAYHESRGERGRDACLIPLSAHGTNPASAVMAGFEVVPVACDERGDIDLADLKARIAEQGARLGALMITYPSTHGVFEEGVREACDHVHAAGGQVYMDGANMNAQVGLCRPADIGADVCHLNLHKTFCIPHGGGGPGMGPIGVAKHLAPFLPAHPLAPSGPAGADAIVVSSAPFGSASILPIPWVYIALMGAHGLKQATQVAILNANYMAKRLESHYDVLYRGPRGLCAHEFILDCRPLRAAGVEAEDVAKRLMDYGFHAPTMSWPVAGTLMIEPTESEPLAELDRFCEAMIHIREEVRAIERGELPRDDNPLKNAPHSQLTVCDDGWARPYSRQRAAFPVEGLRAFKFWPAVDRIDNPYGDRNLVCACEPMAGYAPALAPAATP